MDNNLVGEKKEKVRGKVKKEERGGKERRSVWSSMLRG